MLHLRFLHITLVMANDFIIMFHGLFIVPRVIEKIDNGRLLLIFMVSKIKLIIHFVGIPYLR